MMLRSVVLERLVCLSVHVCTQTNDAQICSVREVSVSECACVYTDE